MCYREANKTKLAVAGLLVDFSTVPGKQRVILRHILILVNLPLHGPIIVLLYLPPCLYPSFSAVF